MVSSRRVGGWAAVGLMILPSVMYIASSLGPAGPQQKVGPIVPVAGKRALQYQNQNEPGASCMLVTTEYDASGNPIETQSVLPEGAGFGDCPEDGVLRDLHSCKPECKGDLVLRDEFKCDDGYLAKRATCRIHVGSDWIKWYHWVGAGVMLALCSAGCYALCDYCGQCGGDHMELVEQKHRAGRGGEVGGMVGLNVIA